MKRVLFVAYGAGHIRTLLPILKTLVQDNLAAQTIEPLILGLTTAKAEVETAGFNCLGFSDLVVPGEDDEALRLGRELVGDHSPDSPVSYKESVAYMGLSYRDLVRRWGESAAKQKYRELGRTCFLPEFTAQRALKNLKIDAVVSTNSPRAERAFLTAARDRGFPSVAIWPSLGSFELEWIGQPGFTTKVCVDSQYATNQLVKAGRSEDEIILTGNPQFDMLMQGVQKSAIADFRRSKGWADDERVLLFAAQIEPDRHPFTQQPGDSDLPKKMATALADAVNAIQGRVKLCIRDHPNRKSPLVMPGGNVSVSNQGDDPATLLHSVDAVFTCSSTMGYQAAMIGKPLVQGMFSMFSAETPFAEMAGAKEVSEMRQFSEVFVELGKDQLQPSTFPKIDKSRTAAAQVLDVLMDVLP